MDGAIFSAKLLFFKEPTRGMIMARPTKTITTNAPTAIPTIAPTGKTEEHVSIVWYATLIVVDEYIGRDDVTAEQLLDDVV